MHYHAIAILSGDRRKSIVNKSEEDMLTTIVIPYVRDGAIKTRWGMKTQSFQVIELRVYKTATSWSKKSGVTLEDFLKGKRNVFKSFEKKATEALKSPSYRVFVIMPIQGARYGSQDEQRVYREYDERFEVIESILGDMDCVAIRIDKEHPLEDVVGRIKDEIRRAKFIVADLTDERQSCYFEAGYSEALDKPVIYIASKESVLDPGTPTRIHFDIHMNINMFTNHKELGEKLRAAIEKNKKQLFSEPSTSPLFTLWQRISERP